MKFKLSIHMMLIHEIHALQLQIETNFKVKDPHSSLCLRTVVGRNA